MSLKIKLTSTIVAFFLILGLVIMGVWAAPSVTVNLGGSLTFQAGDVYAKVTGSVSGAQVNPTLQELNYSASASPTENQLNSWKQGLAFDNKGSEITITVTVQNLATDRPLYVSVEDSVGTVANVTKSMKNGENTYAGALVEVAASGTTTFTLSLKVTDINASIAEGATYGYLIDLQDASNIKTTDSYLTEQGLAFTLHDDMSATVDADYDTSTYTFNAKLANADIVVPSYVNKDGKIYEVTTCGYFSQYDDRQGIFVGCTANSITLPVTITAVESRAFYNVSLGKLTVLGNPTYGDELFNANGPGTLELAYFNKTIVYTIGNWTTELIVHNGVIDFESNYYTFKRMELGAGVTEIKSGYEAGGATLTEIVVEATTPPTLTKTKTELFPNASDTLVVKVPSASLALYQANEYWNTFTLQGV